MQYKEIRNKFIQKTNEAVVDEQYKVILLNPELLQFGEQKFVFLVINDNMDNENEVEKLLRQSMIEGFGFLVVFEGMPPQPFSNLLLSALNAVKSQDPLFPFYVLSYNAEEDLFLFLNVTADKDEIENGQV